MALLFSLVQLLEGHLHAMDVAKHQPSKLAAMEAHWETHRAVPIYALSFPDERHDRNFVQVLPVPAMLSVLAFGRPDAEVKGLKDFAREDRPPVTITFVAFRLMVGLGMLFIAVAILGNLLVLFDWIEHVRVFLWALILAIPLPYLANALGWTVAEVGRQPWIVYGLMRTEDAVSPIDPTQVAITLVGFIVLYGILGLFGFYLLGRAAVQGPEAPPEPAAAAVAEGGQG